MRTIKPPPKKTLSIRIPNELLQELNILFADKFDNKSVRNKTDVIICCLKKGLARASNQSENLAAFGYYTIHDLRRISIRISDELLGQINHFAKDVESNGGKILTTTDAFIYLIYLGI